MFYQMFKLIAYECCAVLFVVVSMYDFMSHIDEDIHGNEAVDNILLPQYYNTVKMKRKKNGSIKWENSHARIKKVEI